MARLRFLAGVVAMATTVGCGPEKENAVVVRPLSRGHHAEQPARPDHDGSEPTPRSEAEPVGDTPHTAVGIELLDVGAEPRRVLKYSVKPGFSVDARIRTLLTNPRDGSVLRDTTFGQRATVEGVHADGFDVLHMLTAESGGNFDDPARSGSGAAAFGGLVGYDSTGRPTAIQAQADDPSVVSKFRTEIPSVMMAPWLPAEAVGVGARWRIVTPATVPQPIRADKTTTSELVSITGSKVTVKTMTSLDAPRQTIDGHGFESQVIRGQKLTTVDLDDPVSVVPVRYESKTNTTMTRRKQGMLVTLEAAAVTEYRRLGPPAAGPTR